MLNRLPLARQAELVRRGEVSPLELLEAHLSQIERINPVLNAFVFQFGNETRSAAKRLFDETKPNSGSAGPLFGVPVTVKDSFDVEGCPTYCGSRLRLKHRAARDSAAVRRLRAAGALLLGKTNVPESLFNYETDNGITGRTNNPWNVDCTPGGSSGGEAAAIAAFCSAGGVGSDGGGSIRVPAHFCGIAGLKPTPGRVSAAGHYPLIAHPGGLLGVAGPMARTVEDVELLFEVLAGPDWDDPFSAPVPWREARLEGLRVGLMERWLDVPVQAAARAAVLSAARVLEGELKIPVEPFEPRGMNAVQALWFFFFVETAAPFLRKMFEGREEEVHWMGRELVEMADEENMDGVTVLEELAKRDAMRTNFLRQMDGRAVLLTPVCGTQAFGHRQRRFETEERPISLLEAMAPVVPFNLFGMPALVIPWQVSGSLPVGIQLVARPWEEQLLLALGKKLEEARGPFPGASAGGLDIAKS